MSALEVLWHYRQAFADGFLVTLQLLVLATLIGTITGGALEWLCARLGSGIRLVVDSAAFAVTTIPALVILFWLHYPAQAMLGIVIHPFWTALTTLTIINAFAIYRIIADAVHDFPMQYIATALVSGLSKRSIFRYIYAPL